MECSPDIQLEKNKISLARFAPSSDVSIILLLEGSNELDNFMPSVSSKTTKGRVFKNIEEVPPNIGKAIIFVIAFILLVFLLYFIPNKIFDYKEKKVIEEKTAILGEYSYLKNEGWKGYEQFIFSNLKQHYPNFEFPVTLSSAKRAGEVLKLQFFVSNKTASVAFVSAYFMSDNENDNSPISVVEDEGVFNLDVSPMSSKLVVVSKKITRNINLPSIYVSFYIKFNSDALDGIKFYPSLNKTSLNAIQRAR